MTRRETVSHIRSIRPSGISLEEHPLVDTFLRCLTSSDLVMGVLFFSFADAVERQMRDDEA